jgi:hypothetical protein
MPPDMHGRSFRQAQGQLRALGKGKAAPHEDDIRGKPTDGVDRLPGIDLSHYFHVVTHAAEMCPEPGAYQGFRVADQDPNGVPPGHTAVGRPAPIVHRFAVRHFAARGHGTDGSVAAIDSLDDDSLDNRQLLQHASTPHRHHGPAPRTPCPGGCDGTVLPPATAKGTPSPIIVFRCYRAPEPVSRRRREQLVSS